MLVLQSLLLSIGFEAFGYLKYVVKRYCNGETSDSEEEKVIEMLSQKSCACTLDEFGLRFWPPLYMQRYMIVQEILEHPFWNGSIKKVADFGCAELGFFKCIKPVPGLNNIMLVDVDFNTLDMNQTKVVPTNYDYLSVSERKEPLTVDIYNGSIADLDDRMLGVDAVICIELIEHLHLDVLNAVPHTVFEFIKPMIAVFTTPNVEFNILFPNFTTQFRHYDHKFEWTRKQFKEWAKCITTRYPEYAVQFDGIGAGPTGTDKLGCCSQMAIFYRKDMKSSPVNPIGSKPYKLLRRVSYPFTVQNEHIKEVDVFEKLRTFILEASINKEYLVNDHMEIPLDTILPHVSDCCSSVEELKSFVSKLYATKINYNGEDVLIKTISECSSEEYKSDSDSLTDNSEQEYNLMENTINNPSDNDSDWNESPSMSFDKFNCFSTPMTKNQKLNYTNSFDAVFSNSDLYKTAVDKCDDMKITSSCNGSIVIGDCNIYNDFVAGRNSSVIDKEDITEIEETLTSIKNDHDNSDVTNCNVINDSTIIQNSHNMFTPMTNNQELNYKNSFDTVFSNSDLYKTAVDQSDDMEISSSCNGSIVIDDCDVYNDFVAGRNKSVIDEEDITEQEETITSIENVDDNSDVTNCNVINDNTVISNSHVSLDNNLNYDTHQKIRSKNCGDSLGINEKDKENSSQLLVCSNRALLDETGYTENLLSIPDKKS